MQVDNTALRVMAVSQLVADGRWRAEALHTSREHLVIWFTKGQGVLRIGGSRTSFGANTVAFIPAGVPHSFDAKPGVYGSAAIIADHPALEMPEAPILYRVRDLISHGEFVNLFEAMQREAARDDAAGNDRACRHHAGILGVWLERQVNHLTEMRDQNASERLANRYTTLLETQFAQGIGVGKMARDLGVTPTHLTRACRQALGASAHELLAERLMYEARERLAGSKTPISAIAKELGFSSPAYFTRAFQKNTGKSPSAFRASHTLH